MSDTEAGGGSRKSQDGPRAPQSRSAAKEKEGTKSMHHRNKSGVSSTSQKDQTKGKAGAAQTGPRARARKQLAQDSITGVGREAAGARLPGTSSQEGGREGGLPSSPPSPASSVSSVLSFIAPAGSLCKKPKPVPEKRKPFRTISAGTEREWAGGEGKGRRKGSESPGIETPSSRRPSTLFQSMFAPSPRREFGSQSPGLTGKASKGTPKGEGSKKPARNKAWAGSSPAGGMKERDQGGREQEAKWPGGREGESPAPGHSHPEGPSVEGTGEVAEAGEGAQGNLASPALSAIGEDSISAETPVLRSLRVVEGGVVVDEGTPGAGTELGRGGKGVAAAAADGHGAGSGIPLPYLNDANEGEGAPRVLLGAGSEVGDSGSDGTRKEESSGLSSENFASLGRTVVSGECKEYTGQPGVDVGQREEEEEEEEEEEGGEPEEEEEEIGGQPEDEEDNGEVGDEEKENRTLAGEEAGGAANVDNITRSSIKRSAMQENGSSPLAANSPQSLHAKVVQTSGSSETHPLDFLPREEEQRQRLLSGVGIEEFLGEEATRTVKGVSSEPAEVVDAAAQETRSVEGADRCAFSAPALVLDVPLGAGAGEGSGSLQVQSTAQAAGRGPSKEAEMQAAGAGGPLDLEPAGVGMRKGVPEVEALRLRVEQQQAALEESASTVASLQDEVARLKAALEGLQMEKEGHEAKVSELVQEKAQLVERLRRVTLGAAMAASQSRTSPAASASAAECGSIERTVSMAEAGTLSLAEVDELKRELAAAKAQHESDVAELRRQLAAAKASHAAEVDDLLEDRDIEVEGLREQVEQLKQKPSADVEALRAELAEAHSRHAAETAELEASLSAAQVTVKVGAEVAQRSVVEVLAEKEAIEVEFESLKKENASLIEEMERKATEPSGASGASIWPWGAQTIMSGGERARLMRQIEDLKAENAEIQDQMRKEAVACALEFSALLGEKRALEEQLRANPMFEGL